METALTRAKFDELTRHLVDMTMEPVQQAMADSGLTPASLSKVLMVGGSSRIPAVQEAVRRFTGKEPFKGINPDECVAMGAALQAGVMGGEVKSLLLLDVTPLSLGIETVGDVYAKIIERNSSIPIQRSQIFTTAASFQTAVDVHVLQGERPVASQNKELGRFRLDGIRRAMRGVPQIEVTFAIDTNGIVNVSARDLGTGRQQNITITSSSNMSREEINRAIHDAEMYAAEDAKKKEEAEMQNRVDNLIYQAETVMKKLSREDKIRMQELVKAAKKALKEKNPAAVRNACTDLERALQAAGQTVWNADATASAQDGVYDSTYEPNDK